MAASTNSASQGIGPKRLVVGAHYGVGGFLAQRITAVLLALYAIFIFVVLLFARDLSYVGWATLFVPVWMKVLTLIAIFALLYHAWIGVKDIWMDYVKPTGIRLVLQTGTALWLIFCAVWSVQILWRV
jgi:succinate dehydrogenase / fumarate reductase membrane anchor subunit